MHFQVDLPRPVKGKRSAIVLDICERNVVASARAKRATIHDIVIYCCVYTILPTSFAYFCTTFCDNGWFFRSLIDAIIDAVTARRFQRH